MTVMLSKYLSAFLLISLFIACGGVKNPEEKVKRIEAKLLSLDSAEKTFASLNFDQLQMMNDSVESHLNYIQRTYVGKQTETLAKPLSNYRSLKKILPDIGKRSKMMESELTKTKKQLSDLKEAIKSGATIDGVGNKIDNAYVERVLKEEMDVATNLIGEINGMGKKAVMLFDRFQEYYPLVSNVVDSLRNASSVGIIKK
jgi:hypothetical protein